MAAPADAITSATPERPPRQSLQPPPVATPALQPSDLLSSPEDEASAFAFTPTHLHQLIESRNAASLHAFGGIAGLARGLRTDLKAGLSADEDILEGKVTLSSILSHDPNTDSSAQGFGHDGTTSITHPPAEQPLPRQRSNPASKPGAYTTRRTTFHTNATPRKPPKSFLRLLWLAYNDKLMFLLTISATISLTLGIYQSVSPPSPVPSDTAEEEEPGSNIEYIEGLAILLAIIVIVLATACNDFAKNAKFARLNARKAERTATVTRSGRHVTVSAADVAVGDVLHVEAGDVVPADGVLVEGFGVRCDESALTGEGGLVDKVCASVAAERQRGCCFILGGTKVETGVGSYLVLQVGANSSYGRIMMALQDEVEETPLQQRLGLIAKRIIQFGLVAGIVAFTVLLIRFLVDMDRIEGGAEARGMAFLDVLILSITVVVIAVPEGLPLTVTLALAFATTRMLKDNNLVRILRSCETMGNATTICSDKTGTLTQNEMSIVAGTLGTSEEFADGSFTSTRRKTDDRSALPSAGNFIRSLPKAFRDLLEASFALNSTAIETSNPGEFIGSNTETALLKFGLNHLGMGPVSEERSNAEIVQMIPFDAKKKWMAVVVKLPTGRYRMLAKGASEVILENCSEVVRRDEQEELDIATETLTPEKMSQLDNAMQEYANRSLRVVAIAYKDFDDHPESPELSGLVFIGAFGIRDPLRPGVIEAVRSCQKAGVFVRMVTGDNFFTATAIAEECGIYTAGGVAMDGPTFRKLTPAQLDLVAPRLQVLARSTPDDKVRLVRHLKGLNEIVAVTGDGTNDALALKAADIGFSMGLSGTEVAKEASSIVLMDDNFASIAKSIGWGRAVNEAAKKFLQFQFTINISAGLLTVVSAFVGGPDDSAFSVVQLLWINLIMDTFAALALATDFPTPGLMLKKPEPRTAPVLNTTMWKMIFGQAIYQIAVIFTLHYAGAQIFGYSSAEQLDQLQTMTFNIYVWMQFFNQTNSRRIDNNLNIFEGVHRNPWFVLVQTVTLAGQVVIVFVGGAAFHTTRLTGAQWGWSMLFGGLTIPIGVLLRLVPDEPLRAFALRIKRMIPATWLRRRRSDAEPVAEKPSLARRLAHPAKKLFGSRSTAEGPAVDESHASQAGTVLPDVETYDLTGSIEATKHGLEGPAGIEVHPDTRKDDPILFDACDGNLVPPSQNPESLRWMQVTKTE